MHVSRFPLLLALLSVACMPPKLSADASTSGEDESDDGNSNESDEPDPDPDPDPDPTDTQTDTQTEGDGDGDGDPETSLTFVPEGDWPIGCECDPFAQDCPEGEKCVGYISSYEGEWFDANKCVPITGEQTAGETCSYAGPVEATDDCDEDSYCFDAQETESGLVGVCRAFCAGTADDPQCADGDLCLISGEGSVTLCVNGCDPLLQDCAEPSTCQWIDTGFGCVNSTASRGLGETCEGFNACAAGLTCVMAEALPACEGAACCTAFCAIGAPVDEDPCVELPGSSCEPFLAEAIPGLEDLGVCQLAP